MGNQKIQKKKIKKSKNPIKNRKRIKNSKEKNRPLVKTTLVALWTSTLAKTWQSSAMCK
jgi:hypothetical protein